MPALLGFTGFHVLGADLNRSELRRRAACPSMMPAQAPRFYLDLGNNPDCSYLEVVRGFKIRDMFAGVLTLAMLGYILNRLFLLIENRVLAWHYGYTQQRS